MPDEIIDNVEETTQELETSVEETTNEEVEETKEEVESTESFLDRLKGMFGGKKEGSEESGDSTSVEEDIPVEFTDAARKAGFDDETILDLADEYTNEELIKLIPNLIVVEPEEEKEEEEEVTKEEEKITLDGKDIDLKTLEGIVEKIWNAKNQEQTNALEERFSQLEQDRSVDEEIAIADATDEFFDRASKSFPVFGKTEELMRFPDGTEKAGSVIPIGPAFEARNAVWKTARVFSAAGMNWNDALQESLDWYKGKNAEKEIRSQVLKDLKSNEKHLSARRTSQQTTKKYENETEEKEAVVLEAFRKAGISV